MLNVKIIRDLYSKLQDDLSREIFESRLLHSITRDKRHIAKIVSQVSAEHSFLLEPLSTSQLIELVNTSDKPAILYGAGVIGKAALDLLGKNKVKCFWDRKGTGEFHGFTVNKPGDGYEGEPVVVATTVLYANDIIQNLRGLCVADDRILVSDFSGEDLEHQYFDEQIIKFSDNEVFVDGGSYNFGTSKLLLKKCNTVKHIYSFEPDSNHWESVLQGIAECGFENVTFEKKGLYSCDATLMFESDLSQSHISDIGTAKISVTSIDDAINETVTFIKMDVEGGELEALKGAAKHIVRDKPKLAIAVYHKPEDILDIPYYILTLQPEYKLFLRHYSTNENETVLYAVI